MRRLSITLVFLVLVPHSAFAEEFVTRAEGLRMIWEPLKRPAEETREPQFTDVSPDHPEFAIIRFAKARGMVEDGSQFYPDDTLHLNAALLWLLQTRNVDAWENIRYETLSTYVEQYALLPDQAALDANPPLKSQELRTLIDTLDLALRSEIHTVSYYSDEFAGDHTAFGEIFDPNALTAAHRTLPHNTLVKVTNTENEKSVTVRINDRGPYIEGRDMDLSRAAFSRITSTNHGVIGNVRFERLGSAVEVANDALCSDTYFQRRVGDTLFTPGIPATIPVGTVLTITADHAFLTPLLRLPGDRVRRSNEWKETLTLSFKKEGIATVVLQTDAGRKRRLRTKVVSGCL
ncbi:MAG TPA: septal ring lytic transglycosylase RlpA family protein [Candidatus Peribacterales bacterium]|nr:septal ring lytic transglycosylase RlpA family protein [Candidatus Peribacterales bacterium]